MSASRKELTSSIGFDNGTHLLKDSRNVIIATRGEKDFAEYGDLLVSYDQVNSAPNGLWLFGEKGVICLSIFVVMDDPFDTEQSNEYRNGDLVKANPVYKKEIAEAQKLFPEALVGVDPHNPKSELRRKKAVEEAELEFQRRVHGYSLKVEPPPDEAK